MKEVPLDIYTVPPYRYMSTVGNHFGVNVHTRNDSSRMVVVKTFFLEPEKPELCDYLDLTG
jgi:hypothetical protein